MYDNYTYLVYKVTLPIAALFLVNVPHAIASESYGMRYPGQRVDDRALELGYEATTEAITPLKNAPFLRMVRSDGANPLEILGCARIDFMNNIGKLDTQELTPSGRAFESNPYIYSGIETEFECKDGTKKNEYVEAGLGFLNGGPDPEWGSYFVPYMRRDTDDLVIEPATPPEGWVNKVGARPAGVIPLPGYWEAANYHPVGKYYTEPKRDDAFNPSALQKPLGSICFGFRYENENHRYVFHYILKDPVFGSPATDSLGNVYQKYVKMPSITASDDGAKGCKDGKLTKYAVRLLSTVAIRDDAYDPTKEFFKNLGIGVTWFRSLVSGDHLAQKNEQMSARNFSILNADTTPQAQPGVHAVFVRHE